VLSVREYLLSLRQEAEVRGDGSGPTRIRKLWDIEAETNDYYARLAESHDSAEVLARIGQETAPDTGNLLWEFALYGEGGSKPRLRRSSAVWTALGLDPRQLQGMTPEDGLWVCLSRFQALFGLGGKPPEEFNLLRLLRWVIETHLPPEQQPETTSEAQSKAIEAGLIHRGLEVKDRETGEVVEVEVEDRGATRFIHQAEARDELDRIVSRLELSPGERLVFMGIRKGLEGKQLTDWVEARGEGLSRTLVPVLARRVMSKLKVAAKT